MPSTVLEKVKLACEITAYGFAAIFLITKVIGGQANAAMEVSMEMTRGEVPAKPDTEYLAVSLKLKRSDIGRLEINDVVLDVIDLTDPKASQNEIRVPSVARERETKGGKVLPAESGDGTFLPPNDATQLGYLVSIKRGSAVRVDATILASRTGPWYGKPQWRVSGISLPVTQAASAPKTGG